MPGMNIGIGVIAVGPTTYLVFVPVLIIIPTALT